MSGESPLRKEGWSFEQNTQNQQIGTLNMQSLGMQESDIAKIVRNNDSSYTNSPIKTGDRNNKISVSRSAEAGE